MSLYLKATRALAAQLPAPRLVRSRSDSSEETPSLSQVVPLLSPVAKPPDWSVYRTTHKTRSGVPFSLEDRWALAGMTRTGKTTVTRNLIATYLRAYPGLRVHIFDPKDVGDYDALVRLPGIRVLHVRGARAPDLLREPGVLIWHPKRAAFDEYERFFQQIADDPAPSLTVVDETRRLIKRLGDGTSYPAPFATILQEGAGQLHSMIVLLQEIAGTPRQIVGQATHLLRFRLENAYDERASDRRYARARASGRITTREPAHWHGFYHARVDMLDAAREYSDWRAFL